MENGKPLSKHNLKCLLQMIESRTADGPADLWITTPCLAENRCHTESVLLSYFCRKRRFENVIIMF